MDAAFESAQYVLVNINGWRWCLQCLNELGCIWVTGNSLIEYVGETCTRISQKSNDDFSCVCRCRRMGKIKKNVICEMEKKSQIPTNRN